MSQGIVFLCVCNTVLNLQQKGRANPRLPRYTLRASSPVSVPRLPLPTKHTHTLTWIRLNYIVRAEQSSCIQRLVRFVRALFGSCEYLWTTRDIGHQVNQKPEEEEKRRT